MYLYTNNVCFFAFERGVWKSAGEGKAVNALIRQKKKIPPRTYSVMRKSPLLEVIIYAPNMVYFQLCWT